MQMNSAIEADTATFAAVAERAMLSKADGVLFADEYESYTGAEAHAAVARTAARLAAAGASKGSRAAFLVGASARHALAFVACQQMGIVPCALHLREPVSRLAEALDWLDVDIVVCDPEHEELAAAALAAASTSAWLATLGESTAGADIALGRCFLRDELAGAIEIDVVTADDVALIILSSGTTGAPKGTINLQRTLAETARPGRAIFGDITSESAVIVPVAPSAAAWIHIVLPFLAAGAAIHFLGRFEPAAYVDTIERQRITHAPGVPTMWRMVLAELERRRRSLERLRVAFFAGEVGSRELVDGIKAKLPHAHIRTGYLSAEGGCASACVADESALIVADKPTTAGRPIDGCDLWIVSPEGSIDDRLAAGNDGEIVLRSPSIAAGYWKADDLTARRFVNGWWRSGDMGHLDDDGDLFIVGRTDHVVNTGGIKVHAEEVEVALMAHPAVTIAAVVPEPDERWGQVVVAHVVVSDTAVTADDILGFCRAQGRLATVKLPKKIIFHDQLPVGPTGKLNRRALRTGSDIGPNA